MLTLPSVHAAVKRSAISDIKVFVFTAGPDEGELVTPQTVSLHKQGLDSVADLKKQLPRSSGSSRRGTKRTSRLKFSREEMLDREQQPPAATRVRMAATAFTFLSRPAVRESSLQAIVPMLRLSVREERPPKTLLTKSRNGLVATTTS
jgi:hypothetical protein